MRRKPTALPEAELQMRHEAATVEGSRLSLTNTLHSPPARCCDGSRAITRFRLIFEGMVLWLHFENGRRD